MNVVRHHAVSADDDQERLRIEQRLNQRRKTGMGTHMLERGGQAHASYQTLEEGTQTHRVVLGSC